MPNRQDAVFESLEQLREQVEQQSETIGTLAKQTDVAKAAQQILYWVVLAAVGVGAVVLYFRH